MNTVLLKIFNKRFFICALLLLSYTVARSQPSSKVTGMQCEHLVDPIGIDAKHPRLSWQMRDSSMEAAQTAYRVIVDKDSLAISRGSGRMWDSKKMHISNSLITYQGKTLEPFTKYFWAVQVWNEKGMALHSFPLLPHDLMLRCRRE